MLSVDDVAQNLSERFLATLQSETSVQDALLRMRLNETALKREHAELDERTRLLEEKAREALRDLIKYVHRDTAFMAFADALFSVAVQSIEDVKRNAALIKSRARDAAGFDVMPYLSADRDGSSPPAGMGLDRVDVESFRKLMSETIRGRLHRTSLADLLSITRDLGEPALGYELRTSFERLDALTLRVSAQWEPRLKEASQLYLEGKLEIPEVARLVGASPSDIAAEFERLGFTRSPAVIRLSEEERLHRAEQALKRVPTAGLEVTREVIASQRIEGIDARRHFDKP